MKDKYFACKFVCSIIYRVKRKNIIIPKAIGKVFLPLQVSIVENIGSSSSLNVNKILLRKLQLKLCQNISQICSINVNEVKIDN